MRGLHVLQRPGPRAVPNLHSRDVTYATFCQGPYHEGVRCRDFMGWDVPWYSAQDSADALLAGCSSFMLVCYLRHANRVFETYWTTGRGVELHRTYGRPTAQWSRLESGRSDDLGTVRR
ncbi:MAG TPA: DUF899 family protein [Pseudonocardiaceae bacterium]